MAAGCLIATGSAVAGLPVPPGTVETVFAGGGWFGALSDSRRRDLERVMDRAARELEAEMAVWVPQSSQASAAVLANATASLNEVLPFCMPNAGDLAGQNLAADAIAALVLKRAEAARPEVYRDRGPRDATSILARRFLSELVERACTRLLAEPGFIDDLRPTLWRELLERAGRIEGNTDRLLDGQQAQSDQLARMEAMLAAMDERTTAARECGITDAALIELARRFTAGISDPQQAFRELENAVGIAIRVQQEGRQGSNLGAFIDEVLTRVAELSAKGAYDDALSEIDAALNREAEAERLLAERRVEGRGRTLRLLDAGIEQDLLRRDAESAAARLVRKAELDRPEGVPLFDHLRAVQDEWYARGSDKGLNLDLEVSISLARHAVKIATDADERGNALNDLGIALCQLGERETGMERLEQAVEIFRLALEQRTRKRVLLDWAVTQNNLGNGLRILGTREVSTGRLEEAIVAFRLALEVWTRERGPLIWAGAQNNLGIVLAEIGEREVGTACLEQAAAAYRLALEEYTRERAPLLWAATQDNLGSALLVLGTRETGMERLEQAVVVFRLGLEERTRERVPLQWAATQNNIGNALQELGHRETGTARLEQAVEHYQLALEERTRQRVPFNWAETQFNLGNVLLKLGRREAGTMWLEEAAEAYRLALEERTRERVPLNWAKIQNNLGNALLEIGMREMGAERMEQAVCAYKRSLEVFGAEENSHRYWMILRCLARTHALLEERRKGG